MLYWSLIWLFAILGFNTFGLAKVYKRFFKNVDIVWCLTFGLLSTFAAFCLPLLPVTLGQVSIYFLSYYFLTIQIILLIIYVINWRWFFITWKLDWNKIVIYFILMIAVFLGWFFTNKLLSYNSFQFIPPDAGLLSFIETHTINTTTPDIFANQADLIQRALFYNLLTSYLSLFDFDAYNIAMFLNVFSLVTYIIFFTFVIMTVFYNRNISMINKYFFLPAFAFVASFLNMALSKNLYDFQQFLTPLIFLMVWIHYTKYEEIASKLSIIVINLISFMALTFNMSFLILFTILYLITLGISYYTKKQRATDYNIFNLFIIILSWSLIFKKVEYLSIVLFVVVICIYVFYVFYRTSKAAIKINEAIDQFFYKWIVAILSLCVFIVLLTIVIYYASNDYNDTIFKIWELNQFFGINLNDEKNKAIFWSVNVFYWLINIFIFVYAIITLWVKRKKIGQISYMEVSFLSILLFWNPLSLDLIQKFFGLDIFSISGINYIDVFLIPAVPLFISATKICISTSHKNIYNISYMSVLSLVTLVSMVLLNLY